LDIPIDKTICFAAEVGLSGEIRPVNMINARIKEAAKLGFKQFMLSEYNKKNIEEKPKGINLIFVKTMQDVLKQLFG
jgi:DNA repair protein RadA/Sms